MKNQTFGIEIEMTGLTRYDAAKAVAKYFGTTESYAGGGYYTYEVKDQAGRIWKLMRDASIRAEKKDGSYASDDYKVEMVSPICTYGDIETVQEIVRLLRKAGAIANDSCGIHIHIGKDGHTARSLKNIVNIMASKEDMLFKALEVDHIQALDGESLLRVNLLIEKEHLKYLENAVRFAKSDKARYERELNELKAKHNKRGEKERKTAIVLGLITLPLIAIVLGNLFYAFFQTGLPYLIFSVAVCIIPYALSVIGMAFYAKAKHEGNNSKSGLALTRLSLIHSNIGLVMGVIFLIKNKKSK